ncbi:ribonuclease H-like domain-containing protein [Tanacetum coccineum]
MIGESLLAVRSISSSHGLPAWQSVITNGVSTASTNLVLLVLVNTAQGKELILLMSKLADLRDKYAGDYYVRLDQAVLFSQDLCVKEVIENGNLWVPNPVTAPESGPSTALKMTVPSTAEEKICEKNDVKAKSFCSCTFGWNEATKRTQKALLKQQYENFNASSSESLDSIFNRLQKLVSRLTISVSTGTIKVNTASTETSTASFSDATVYAFLSTQPQGSQLVHEDLEQLHDDDLEEMDLKWNMALLSMRARKFYQRTGRKIIIDGSSTVGYDKLKVECFNCHKMGHFARECRAPRSKDNRNWNQGSLSKAVRIEDASKKAMCAIDGVGFDWSDMAEE